MSSLNPKNMINSQSSGTPIRRRRFALLVVLLLAGVLVFLYAPWEIFGVSRANVSQLMRYKKTPVDEIYGLLHLVTDNHENAHVLSNADLDLSAPLDLSTYAAGDLSVNWYKEKVLIDKEYPVVVFSKTYCPYSKRAKALLESYNLQPPPKIIEVDLREDGMNVKHLLARLTRHSTFPNILLRGNSIGGSDRLQQLHANKSLKKLFEEAGAISLAKESRH